MALPTPRSGAVAVVTGASSGIGGALAHELARRKYPLMLVARRRERLEALAAELTSQYGVPVEVRPCDLADPAQRHALSSALASMDVAVLCNNAGVGSFGRYADGDADRELEQVELNVVAVHELTLAVVPGMRQRGEGAILITGSTAGFQPMPLGSTYAAGKAFANALAESLHGELKGEGIICTLLAPGPVRTEFAKTANIEKAEVPVPGVWLSAERVARDAVRGMERGKRVVVPGVLAKIAACSGRHTPRSILIPVIRLALGGISGAK
jgi:uncharacterized protein